MQHDGTLMTDGGFPGLVPMDGSPDPGLGGSMLFVELKQPDGSWLAYAIYRSEHHAGWLGGPPPSHADVDPVLAYEYWSEKDANGHSYAVFGYWVESVMDAIFAFTTRQKELASGTAPPHDDAPSAASQPASASEDDGNAIDADQETSKAASGIDARLPHATSQALIWRLATELVRRYPDRLWIGAEGGTTEEHEDGWYDRITVVDIKEPAPKFIACFNAEGSGLLLNDGVPRWTSAYRPGVDRSAWLTELAQRAGLPDRPHGLPPSTPQSLVQRYVAAFLALQIGARTSWLVRPPKTFGDFRSTFVAANHWQQAHPEFADFILCLAPATGYGGSAKLALSIHGDLWRDDRQHFHLPSLHKSGKPATAILLETVPDLLP